MSIHDWTSVPAGIFHDFHHTWITEIKRALNDGLLPPAYYALAEQIASGRSPDVLTLPADDITPEGGILLAERKPKVRYHSQTDGDHYAAKAKTVTIRHVSNHQVVAVVEIVSPGNKSSRNAMKAFVDKAFEALATGIHLAIVDLFPPGPRDPEGVHRLLWEDPSDEFVFSADKPMTCVAYIGGLASEAFIEPVGYDDALPELPLFLTPEVYIPLPLAATYQGAWEALPAYWRDALNVPPASGSIWSGLHGPAPQIPQTAPPEGRFPLQ